MAGKATSTFVHIVESTAGSVSCGASFRWRLLAVASLLAVNSAFSQSFGNEWINTSQSYYKLKVAGEGIYRLTHAQLQAAGVPLATLDARRLQLFHRGVEQAIHVPGQEDGRLDPADFIEFYGKPADGATDTGLYLSPEAQPHTLYNLFSDSAAYFLTWPLTNIRGKRMADPVPINNVDNLPEEPFHIREVLKLQTNNYSQGRTYSNGEIILSQYDFGEGWTGSDIPKGNNQEIALTGLTNRVLSAPPPVLEVLLVGRNNLSHKVEIYAGPASGGLRLWQTVEFSAHDPAKVSGEINWSDISTAGQLVVRVNVVGFPDAADRAAVSYVRLAYAQALDMEEKTQQKFGLRESATSNSFIKIKNAPPQLFLYDLTAPDDVKKIGIVPTGSDVTAVVEETTGGKHLLATSSFLSVAKISRAPMPVFDPAAVNYIIISHTSLRKKTSSGMDDPVLAYKTYRESAAGGGYAVLSLDIAEVFDLFSYGEVSPLAIRRLGAYLLANGDPHYIFLIGKGTTVNYNFYRQTAPSFIHLIPTYGSPGSDIAILAGLGNTTYESAISIGRLNARHADDVEAYYKKVVEMEAAPFDNLWRKNMIHLSGGATQAELNIFRRYLDGFKRVASGKYVGANVVTSSKATSNAIEFINIAGEVNSGVSLITFFGHSASFSTDIDIGVVSNPGFGYNNKGKYPVILVNGCDAGNIFANVFTLGEDWTLTPGLGALGFIAHSYKGFSPDLRDYSTDFYQVAFGDSLFVAKSLGEIKDEASRRFLMRPRVIEREISQVQQMVLQGDPAVRIFGAGKPDYAVDAQSLEVVDVAGQPLRVAKDTFALQVIVRNYGIATGKPLKITMRRRLDNGSVTEASVSKDPILRQDTVYFGISNQELTGLGNNTFEIFLDGEGAIDELNEANNSASLNVFLAKGSTIHLFPPDRGVAGPEPALVMQTADILSLPRTCAIEIDTLPSFNSPFKKQFAEEVKVISVKSLNLAEGGAIPDSTVIYWRSKFLNPVAGEDTSWVQSSFTMVRSGGSGFTSVSANQFADAEIKDLILHTPTFSWTFPENNTSLEVRTHGGANSNLTKTDIDVIVGGAELLVESTNFTVCRENTFNAVAFDRQSTVPYPPVAGWSVFNNQLTCGLNPKRINNFTDNEMFNPTAANGGLRRLSQFIDAIPNGDFVVFFNIGSVQYSRWDAEVKDKLKLIGIKAATLNNLQDGQPVIFFGKKGSAEGTAVEVLSDGSSTTLQQQQLALTDIIEGRYFSGGVASGRIGPAKTWGTAHHKVKLGVSQTESNYHINIYGVKKDGERDALLMSETSPVIDLSGYNAATYPYMELSFSTSDEQTLQPVQLRQWGISFEQVPEGVLLTHAPAARSQKAIVKNEGEGIAIPFTYFNVSPEPFTDSLTLRHEILVKETNTKHEFSTKVAPLASGDSVTFEVDINTLGKAGLNDLRVMAEPTETELFTNNNRFHFSDFLEVKPDVVNPVLDVTIDGSHILNGDIVSPDPVIAIRLTDDYPYIVKQDTIGMEVFLKSPCEECGFERVAFSGGKMTWSFNAGEEEMNIEYRPGPLANGLYSLRVIASDASGNQAGTAPYEITFEVINETSVTHFYPYPNPFSTSTRFVFTLTGASLPDQLKIQIMTVSGRIVREITQDEIGPLKIGNNISEFAWDGTDEYGDQLANGVYLYRVQMKMNGQQPEHRTTSADKAFKNGFGKMYLLR